MQNFIKLGLLILFNILMFHNLNAQYLPYFKNYNFSEHNIGNQNWDVSIAENGKVYVANNKGLLEFDGLVWNFKELPNKTIIRSVFTHKNIIYTGSYQEFGYWQHNSKGELCYTSLSEHIQKDISTDEEFWQISLYKNIIVFKSFSNIYLCYPDHTIKKINLDSTLINCSVVNNQLYLATLNKGVYVFKEEQKTFVWAFGNEILNNNNIISINKYNDNNLLIVTALKGCFLYDGDVVKSTEFAINNIIKEHQLNKFLKLKDGRCVFGTIKNGVYLTNNEGDIISHISKENGLINNTILGQAVSYKDQLWLALDNGLAFVDFSSDVHFFNDVSGKLATVYDVIDYEGTIYIGSNTGLFYIDKQSKLQFVKGTQGQVWSLKEVDGNLLCGHNNGTFLVKNKQVTLISNYTGGFVVKKTPIDKGVYVQGTYGGLVKLTKNNKNKWIAKHLGSTTMPVENIVFEDTKTAWLAHAYKGVYKVTFDERYNTLTSIKDYKNKGICSDYNVRIHKIKNDICFETNNGWKKYEPLIDSIVPYDLINEHWGKNSYVISEEEAKQVFYKNEEHIISLRELSNHNDKIILNSNYYKGRLPVGEERISQLNDSIYALGLKDGFMLINANKPHNSHLYKPDFSQIIINKNTLVDLALHDNVEMNYNESVEIALSSPKSENFHFEYKFLNKNTSQWHKLDKNVLELNTLNQGNYNIVFRTVNYLGTSPEIVLNLKVLPPWYKGVVGYVLYAIILLLAVLVFVFLSKKRTERNQRILKIKMQKEHQKLLREKAFENEKKMIQIKNESLKNELKLKSKQLANTAIALIKKNESLQEVKNELEENKKSIDNKYLFNKLVKKVDRTIGNEDEWELFEYNFNQVHEDFFIKLKEKHPKLTQKDLKICAYIKMNLLSKEIAPLMNVTIRGLETHRYRLKRKLNLENDNSLSNYLKNFE